MYEWIAERLGEHGLRMTEQPEPHRQRPWSTVLKIRTDSGTVWFKANGAGTAYEVRLLDALQRFGAPCVPAPLALDFDRAWSLLPDAGTPLRGLVRTSTSADHWTRILGAYAELQRTVTPRAAELVALGVPDLRPAAMPDLYVKLLADTDWLGKGTDDGLSAAEHHRLEALVPIVTRWGEQLDAASIPPTVQHDDFHDGNIFVREGASGPDYAFLDWGDASIAHPFASLLVVIRHVTADLDHETAVALAATLRDAYLEPWTGAHSRAELLDVVRSATQLAKVGRALAWQRALSGADEAERRPYAEAVPGWLRELFVTEIWT